VIAQLTHHICKKRQRCFLTKRRVAQRTLENNRSKRARNPNGVLQVSDIPNVGANRERRPIERRGNLVEPVGVSIEDGMRPRQGALRDPALCGCMLTA